MDHNQDREATFRENQARARVLSKEVRHLQEEKSKQVRTGPPLTTEPHPGPHPGCVNEGAPKSSMPWLPFLSLGPGLSPSG